MFIRLLIIVSACLFAVGAVAYESDQYLNRTAEVDDSLALMDEQVNLALERVLSASKPPDTEKAVARAIYYEIGGWYWADS